MPGVQDGDLSSCCRRVAERRCPPRSGHSQVRIGGVKTNGLSCVIPFAWQFFLCNVLATMVSTFN